jgi:hypothetical protein
MNQEEQNTIDLLNSTLSNLEQAMRGLTIFVETSREEIATLKSEVSAMQQKVKYLIDTVPLESEWDDESI